MQKQVRIGVIGLGVHMLDVTRWLIGSPKAVAVPRGGVAPHRSLRAVARGTGGARDMNAEIFD
jgi:predicted dehydrogenase